MANQGKAPAIRAILKKHWRRWRACATACNSLRRDKTPRVSAGTLDASLGISRVSRNRVSRASSRGSPDSRVSKENPDSRGNLDSKGSRDNPDNKDSLDN